MEDVEKVEKKNKKDAKKSIFICVILSVLIACLAAITIFIINSTNKLNENTTLYKDGVAIESLKIDETMYPGEVVTYDIEISTRVEAKYEVSLRLDGEESLLSDNMALTLKYGEKEVSKDFSSLIENDQYFFDMDLKYNKKEKINVSYTLNKECGNEIAGLAFDFDINFKISVKGFLF